MWPHCRVSLLLRVVCPALPRSVVGAGVLLVFAPTVVPAYLDPGAAYMGLQWVLGIVAGGVVAVGLYWQQIKAASRRWFKRGGQRLPSGTNDRGENESLVDGRDRK